jgi:hypothetical protein
VAAVGVGMNRPPVHTNRMLTPTDIWITVCWKSLLLQVQSGKQYEHNDSLNVILGRWQGHLVKFLLAKPCFAS